MEDDETPEVPSLLPYDAWTAEALRLVVLRALEHVVRHGLPGPHHFYLTFLTDYPGVVLPARLKAQYPHEMTIVLQHQFWDLAINDTAASFSVRLSFSGVPTTITVPFAAMTAFADPAVRYGLRFVLPPAKPEAEAAPPTLPPADESAGDEAPQVVSLETFRKRSAPKE